MLNHKKKGKQNRAAGVRFELKVRKDLEDKGWIVSKWMNNVEFGLRFVNGPAEGKLIPAKHKFRGPGIPMAIGTGFPDFIAHLQINSTEGETTIHFDPEQNLYILHGIEVKSNGYLTKEEKEKCKWLLDNDIFSKILIAKKGTKRGEIIYDEYKSN